MSVRRVPAEGKPLTVRVDANFDRRLQAAASREGVSVSEFVRQAITERLDRGAGESRLWIELLRPWFDGVWARAAPEDTPEGPARGTAPLRAGRITEDCRRDCRNHVCSLTRPLCRAGRWVSLRPTPSTLSVLSQRTPRR